MTDSEKNKEKTKNPGDGPQARKKPKSPMGYGFRKLPYIERIVAALDQKRAAEAEKAAAEAFADRKFKDEIELARIAVLLYDREIDSSVELLEEFVNRFPDSLSIPRVLISEILCRCSRFDEAADEARQYLRQAMDAGFPDPALAGRAALVLACSYSDFGALSYAARILGPGLGLIHPEETKKPIARQLGIIEKTLKDESATGLDSRWESFFGSGSGGDELVRLCRDHGNPLMAERIELLEKSRGEAAAFPLGSDEMTWLVMEAEDGELKLG